MTSTASVTAGLPLQHISYGTEVETKSPDVKDVSQEITTDTEVCEDYPTIEPLLQEAQVMDHASKELENVGEDCLESKKIGHAGKPESLIVQEAQPFSQTNNLPESSSSSYCKCREALIKSFRCGVCYRTYKTVCKLHKHFEYVHSETDVYVFDILTNTAFPRYKRLCKLTQTDTEVLYIENREAELVHLDNKDTEILHDDDKDTVLLQCEDRNPELLYLKDRNTELLHREDRNPELLHREDRNPELLHREARNPELPHLEDRNTELLYRERRNTNLMQYGKKNTEMLLCGNGKPELLHCENRNTEMPHLENGETKRPILETDNMIEIVNDELSETDKDLERSFNDALVSAPDVYRKDPSEMNTGTDHPPLSVSVQTPWETTEPIPSQYSDSYIQDSSVCLDVDVLKSKIEKQNKPKSWKRKIYIKAQKKRWNRKKGGKANAIKIKIKAEEKGLLCKICDKAFPSNFALERHNRRLHWIKCNDCGEKIDQDQMKDHKKALHSYRCLYCRETFADINARRSHLKTHPPLFVCTYKNCGKKYRTKACLETHEKNHTLENQIQRIGACHLCGKIMRTVSLKQHSCIQSRKRHFKCDLCQKEFRLKSTLKIHLQTHTCSLEKPHVCMCGKAFSNRGNLTIHSRIHSGEKPYICEVCGAQFSSLSGINRHMQTHTQDKAHVCQCGKAFSNLWNLNAHSRQHSGEKPYICEVCGAQFTHNVSRKNHMKKHTGVSDS